MLLWLPAPHLEPFEQKSQSSPRNCFRYRGHFRWLLFLFLHLLHFLLYIHWARSFLLLVMLRCSGSGNSRHLSLCIVASLFRCILTFLCYASSWRVLVRRRSLLLLIIRLFGQMTRCQ